MGLYSDGHRELQDRFDSRRLADRIEKTLVHDRLTAEDCAFIQARDQLFLATADAQGQPTCSYKGGDPGFVRVLDERTLAFPSFDGNGMFLSLGNVTRNPKVGLLFIDLEGGSRLRVEGEAGIDPQDPLLGEVLEAQVVVRVRVQTVYPNCGRYIHRYQKLEPSRFVPRAGARTPQPGWKKSDWARDVLPATDQAKDPKGGG